ncbi:MAG: PilZ domain-containing protein [Phycisphaerae bacterium]|jgi:hypothetical protein
MAIDLEIDCQVIDSLIDELDVKASAHHLADQSASYWVCQRRHPRHPFRVPCRVRFLTPGVFTVKVLPGRTRNLSRSGIGLVVRRVFAVQEPIEVEVLAPGRPATFMAGVVRFCRYAGRGYHEIGVQLRAAGPHPIISKEPLLAAQTLDWVKPVESGMR